MINIRLPRKRKSKNIFMLLVYVTDLCLEEKCRLSVSVLKSVQTSHHITQMTFSHAFSFVRFDTDYTQIKLSSC